MEKFFYSSFALSLALSLCALVGTFGPLYPLLHVERCTSKTFTHFFSPPWPKKRLMWLFVFLLSPKGNNHWSLFKTFSLGLLSVFGLKNATFGLLDLLHFLVSLLKLCIICRPLSDFVYSILLACHIEFWFGRGLHWIPK